MKKASRIVVLMLFAGLISLSLVGCKKEVDPLIEAENQTEMMENEKIANEKKEAEKGEEEEKKDDHAGHGHAKGEHPK